MENDIEVVGLDVLAKLDRAVKKSASSMTRESAGSLVKTYYGWQEHRIALTNQFRTARESGRPDEDLMSHFVDQVTALEKQMVGVLGAWAAARPEGAWAQEQKGIGPVLSAALSAHIDVRRAQTAGAIWRFAGLDATVEWQGTKAAREMITAAWDVEPGPLEALWWVSRATQRRMEDLVTAGGVQAATADQAAQAVAALTGTPLMEVVQAFEDRPIHVDNGITYACSLFGVEAVEVYRALYGGQQVDRDAVAKLLAKRPWNADLKVVCWLIGASFVKVSGLDGAFYGQMYRQRKALEVERNEAHQFKDQAAVSLQKRKIRDPELRKTYESGKLPAGRIDLRARRWATKLFLAHWFEVAYEAEWGRPAPLPYPIVHMGHVHKVERP